MVAIDPEVFDLVVAGTGLEESIVAAAAAKAGKSVLHVDAASHYGSTWSSFTLDQFLHWAQQTPDMCASNLADGDLKTIDTLLMFGVQNYLDFKLVQGSYMYSNGKFTSVPASRAAVFRDRTLSPADKRLLTRFLMQLANNKTSQPSPNVSQPFITLLQAEGLSHSLRQFIMYAVAMADQDQDALKHQPAQTAGQSPAAEPSKRAMQSSAQHSQQVSQGSSGEFDQQHVLLQLEASAASRQTAHAAPTQQASSSSGHSQDTHASAGPVSSTQHQQPGHTRSGHSHEVAPAVVELPEGLLSSEAGLTAMRQYLGSVGRYGPNTGALLTPMYGCGELPQAFCRVAAVNGALYILRQPLKMLLLDAGMQRCTGVETEQGQVIKCSAFAASGALLAALTSPSGKQEQGSERAGQARPAAQQPMSQRLSRAVCILDGSLQEGQSQLFVVIPPNSLPSKNLNAIRALQLGPAAAVCPANRTLLYLSTISTAPTAREDLRAAVSALVNTATVFGSATKEQSTDFSMSQSEQQQAQQHARALPTALLVAFYNQTCQQEHAEDALPKNVTACFSPDGSISPDSAVRHAKQCFAKLYPESLSVFEPATGLPADADSDDEALDALSSVLPGDDSA